MPRVQKDLLSGVGGGVSACERVSEGVREREKERERSFVCFCIVCMQGTKTSGVQHFWLWMHAWCLGIARTRAVHAGIHMQVTL